jgi:hypothetical protein
MPCMSSTALLKRSGRNFSTSTSSEEFDKLKEMDNAREKIVSMLAFALNDIENRGDPVLADVHLTSSSTSSLLPSEIDLNTVRAIKDTYLTSASFRLSTSDFLDLIERATSILEKEPIFNQISCSGSTHVVGDLHGSLEDLARIISIKGYPSSENKYIFNGDFVDRCVVFFFINIFYSTRTQSFTRTRTQWTTFS